MMPLDNNPEEEDTDYDIFASVRPSGIEIDDNVSDEIDGEDVDEFAAFRPNEEEINQSRQQKQEKRSSISENVKDFGKQAAKETLIGIGGTYGDLLKLVGLNPGEKESTKQKNQRDFDVLDRMDKPGYKPSFNDILSLSDDDDILPSGGLPTSESLGGLNDLVGGPGEPETPGGSYGKRFGKLYGPGVALGQVNPLAAGAAAGVGEGIEAAGGGELAQTAGEIATLLLTGGRSGKKLGDVGKKEIRTKIQTLRKLGYSDEEITLAINSGSKGRVGNVKATKGAKTQQAFEDFAEKSDQMVGEILSDSITGYERGPQHVHKLASDAYGQVAQQAAKLTIRDSTPFINSATRVVRELRRNLGRNPEAETFLNRLANAVVDSTKNPTAESFMNFYKELNAAGKWMGRSQKDRLITEVKNGIKDTFKSEGKAGRKLAEDFEKVNAGIKKAYDAEEIHHLMNKVWTQEGGNYNKFHKLFDNTENVQLFESVLGKTQADNIRMIAKTGKEVKDFDKAWKAVSPLKGTKTNLTSGAYYLFHQNLPGLAVATGIKGGSVAAKKLAEKSLTDPKYQNLMIRGLHAIKNGSVKTFGTIIDQLQSYLDDEGIDLKLIPDEDNKKS